MQDGKTMAVSADPVAAKTTLATLKYIREEMGCHTSLGVSNVSFGLPQRDIVNSTFFAMALQMAGQFSFVALNKPGKATFFSLLRKVIIVVPLTLLLPGLGFGVEGVFLAEPISNLIGGLAAFITMWITVYRKL